MTAIGSHPYWNDAPLESLPLTPPNAPFFPEPSLSASGRAKLGHEFASYPLLLPPLPIQKPHARQATSERWIADVPAMNFHPAWSSYNTHDRRIRNKHGSGNTKSLNPSPNGPNARQEVQSRVSASFASGMASSRSMGTNSLRVDTTLANGDMSSNRGTVATGGMINHQPTPGHATNVSGHAMQELGSRSMSPARSSGSSTAVTSTNPSPSKRQWSASMLGHGLGGEHPTSESEPDPFTRVQQSTKSVEEFQGTNYPSWRYWFKRKITNPSTGKNLWGHIDGTRPRPKEPSVGCDRKDGDGSDPVERWDMDEAAIYCSLFASISSGIARDQVQACTTAKEVWERLEMLYGDPDISTTRAAQIIRELSQVVYTPGDDLQQHLMGMEGLISKLNKGPYPIPDSLAVWFICDSMPACFLAEVQRLRNSKELSIESVIQRLKAVGDDILGDMCKSKVRYIQTVRRATALPLDLRAYKYGGDGEAGDGQLYRRSQSTCQACLGTGHQALSQECPQTEVRHGLWGKGAGLLSCVGETSPKVVKANSAPNTHRTQEPAFPSNNTSWVHMRRTDTKVKGARNGTYRLVPGQFPEAERTSWRAL